MASRTHRRARTLGGISPCKDCNRPHVTSEETREGFPCPPVRSDRNYSGKTDKLSSSSIPYIPWLPKESKAVPILQDTNNKLNVSNDCIHSMGSKYVTLQNFNHVFPTYIAARYHKMDALKILEWSTEASYWENVGNYLTISTNSGTTPFYNSRKGSVKLIVDKPKPWVLIQLPFQPALLHQWAVAAYAESLISSKRLVEIGSRGYALQFHDLYTKMAKLSQILSKNCNLLLAQFFTVYCENIEENVHVKAKQVFIEQYPNLLMEIMSLMDFFKCVHSDAIFNFIKEKSWCAQNSPEDLKFSTDCSEVGSFNLDCEPFTTVYSDLYWRFGRHGCPRLYTTDLCRRRDKSCTSRSDLNFATAKRFVEEFHPALLDPEKCMTEFKKCIQEEILGTIKGLKNTEIFFNHLDKYLSPEELETVIREFFIHLSYKRVESCKNKEYVHTGIIHQVLSLQSEVFDEHALGVMTRIIWRAAKRFDDNICLYQEVCAPVNEFPMKAMMDMLVQVSHYNNHWSFKNIFDAAEISVSENQLSPELILVGIKVGNNILGVEHSIEEYVRYTRRTVLEMYRKQYLSLQKDSNFVFYPECQVLQYIMPCLLATGMELLNDTALDISSRWTILSLIDPVILSYCTQGYHQNLGIHRKEPFVHREFFNIVYDENFKQFDGTMQRFLKNSVQAQQTVSKFKIYVCDRKTRGNPYSLPDNLKTELLFPTELEMSIWTFLCRIKNYFYTLNAVDGLWRPQQLRAFQWFKKHFSVEDEMLTIRFCSAGSRSAKHTNVAHWLKHDVRATKSLLRELEALSTAQLLAICIHQVWCHRFKNKWTQEKFFDVHQGPAFELDSFQFTVALLLRRDFIALKKSFISVLKRGGVDDAGLIPLEFAKNNKICRPLLHLLTPELKVQMDEPGQATFFPIQHCRWCGVVNASEFRLCAECKDELKYPDPHYFCSKKCEKEALDAFHQEDHAKFVMGELGI